MSTTPVMPANSGEPTTAPLLASYRNGGTQVCIHADGTKVRTTLDAADPPVLPEQMDLKITDWCDAGCAWCHEGSTRAGQHGDIRATLELLQPLPRGTEVAIGGGDPLSHPQLAILVRTLAGRGLVPSVTVNGRHLARHMHQLEALAAEGCLYGVGVSWSADMPAWDYPHRVVHMVAGVDSPRALDDQPPTRVLVLGYKRHGRGLGLWRHDAAPVEAGIAQWFRELPILARRHHLSFDNLAIEQLKPWRLFRDSQDYQTRYMGAEGQYSMYIDAVTQTYGVSSYSPDRQPWTDMASMFAHVRDSTGHGLAPVNVVAP